jgi:hypothetical protein
MILRINWNAWSRERQLLASDDVTMAKFYRIPEVGTTTSDLDGDHWSDKVTIVLHCWVPRMWCYNISIVSRPFKGCALGTCRRKYSWNTRLVLLSAVLISHDFVGSKREVNQYANFFYWVLSWSWTVIIPTVSAFLMTWEIEISCRLTQHWLLNRSSQSGGYLSAWRVRIWCVLDWKGSIPSVFLHRCRPKFISCYFSVFFFFFFFFVLLLKLRALCVLQLGSHLRAKRKREEMTNVLQKQRKAAAAAK